MYSELHKFTLKETAAEMKISITSAFNNRHKLYESIIKATKIKVSGQVQIDAKFVSINLKRTK